MTTRITAELHRALREDYQSVFTIERCLELQMRGASLEYAEAVSGYSPTVSSRELSLVNALNAVFELCTKQPRAQSIICATLMKWQKSVAKDWGAGWDAND